jgi:type 1 glutamine amidotransferase
MKRALIIQGGWEGHQPKEFAELIAQALIDQGYNVDLANDLEKLDDLNTLLSYDLISPNWTMGTLTPEQTNNLSEAIRKGVGLAGFHGGMGDAFRGNLDYEWMVGGHFVGHPYVGEYSIEITNGTHPITQGLPSKFSYKSEQYYMLIDPSINILAESSYIYEGHEVKMPIIWTKPWGLGRVFYSSLGHQIDEFIQYPRVLQMTVNGLLWASKNSD